MARLVRIILCGVFIAGLVGVPSWYYQKQRKHYRAFRVVRPGVLYRSGQLDLAGLEHIVRHYGIRTVISFRVYDGPDGRTEQWEEHYCRAKHIAFVRIPPREWWSDDGPPPADIGVAEFVRVMKDETQYPRPVLIHCFAGEHRTGAFCAIYRMEFEGWSNDAAIAEMVRCGYRNFAYEWDVRGYIESYVPTWRRNPRTAFSAPKGEGRGRALKKPR